VAGSSLAAAPPDRIPLNLGSFGANLEDACVMEEVGTAGTAWDGTDLVLKALEQRTQWTRLTQSRRRRRADGPG